jgi:hypothetical protein
MFLRRIVATESTFQRNTLHELELPPYEDDTDEEPLTEDRENELLSLTSEELRMERNREETNDEVLIGNPFMGTAAAPSAHDSYLEALAEVRK